MVLGNLAGQEELDESLREGVGFSGTCRSLQEGDVGERISVSFSNIGITMVYRRNSMMESKLGNGLHLFSILLDLSGSE